VKSKENEPRKDTRGLKGREKERREYVGDRKIFNEFHAWHRFQANLGKNSRIEAGFPPIARSSSPSIMRNGGSPDLRSNQADTAATWPLFARTMDIIWSPERAALPERRAASHGAEESGVPLQQT